MSRITVIDDDQAICRSLEIQLGAKGHEVGSAHTGGSGIELVIASRPDLVFLDVQLPDTNGLKVLKSLLTAEPMLKIVMITGRQDMQSVIEAVQLGAFDYIRKPLDLDEILISIEKVARAQAGADEAVVLHTLARPSDHPREIVGKDRKIIEVIQQIGMLARSRVTVLIEGDTGTGKELVARALHEASAEDAPFIAVNCSSIVATLWESELFGHEKGSFTGAAKRQLGKCELARNGTLFLDEVGDIPLELQPKLLRALQEREFQRIGGQDTIALNARVVAATNRNLDQMARDGSFREDLLHRIAVARLDLPRLKDRRGDIPLLVDQLVWKIATALQRPITGVTEEVVRQLQAHDWPGNVRELENVLMRSIAFASGEVLEKVFIEAENMGASESPSAEVVKPLRESEKEHICLALAHHGWNITHTAKALEISPTTLRKKISDYGIRA